MANNKIEDIKNHLDNLILLEDLNISANKICHFGETLNLTKL